MYSLKFYDYCFCGAAVKQLAQMLLTVQIYFGADYRAWRIIRNLPLQTTPEFKGNRGDCRETILVTDGL